MRMILKCLLLILLLPADGQQLCLRTESEHVTHTCRPKDPDEFLDTPHLILSRGFKYEQHEIVTQDGYILTCFRIVHPRLNQTFRSVILQHGLLSSSRDFLIGSPGGHVNEELTIVGGNVGFELAKRGYDVWLPNSRGNRYSLGHVSVKGHKFWDFTYADMAKYDVPAVIDHVLQSTGRRDVAYIGYSQGTVTMWAALSLYPKYNMIVKPFIAWAPVMSLQHILPQLRAAAHLPLLPQILGKVKAPFLPTTKALRELEKVFCKPPFKPICLTAFELLGGRDPYQFNNSRIDVYLYELPAGTSNKNIELYAQNIRNNRFAEFDYGSKKNIQMYGTAIPPEFPIEKITNPHIALISGLNDLLASPEDVDVLRSRLKVKLVLDHVIPYEKWTHFDFTFAMEAGKYAIEPTLKLLDKYRDP